MNQNKIYFRCFETILTQQKQNIVNKIVNCVQSKYGHDYLQVQPT